MEGGAGRRQVGRDTTADTSRLFFAVWPAAELQQALGQLAQNLKRECGGRAIPERNIHLTLAFLGNVDRGRRARIEAIASAISARCFELDVAHVEYWRHNRIVWAGVERCPDALQGLASRLEQALLSEGFRFDARPYVPHITLLRDARGAPSASVISPVHWPVSRFALVESMPDAKGRKYEVLRDWPLGTQMSG